MNETVITASVSLGIAILSGAFLAALWPSSIPARVTTGERGFRRNEAVNRYALFALAEPLIRAVAGYAAQLPLERHREKIESKLRDAGYPLGVNTDEYLALTAVLVIVFSLLGSIVCSKLMGAAGAGFVVGAVVGVLLPCVRFQDAGFERTKSVRRSLPHVIDMVALALQAGMDFQNALKQVTQRIDPKYPIRFELDFLLQQLHLGESRRGALQSLAGRIDTPEIRTFVQAVVQSEKQGTPLAEVLTILATVTRQNRSMAAEQAAARAGVLMLGPLLLIFGCVFVILIGPFIVKAISGTLY